MTTREAPPPHRRARDAARTHWIDADRRRAEQTQSMLGAKGGESGRTQDPDSVAFRALRWCRQHLLGTPKPIRDASVNDLMATHIASKYAVLESSPLTHPATSPDDTEPGPGHQELACGYLRALGIAAAWECVFDLLMTSIIVVASVVAGFAFHERGGSLTTAFFVGLTVFLVTRIPASPSIDSLRSIIGRICGLAVLAFLGYVAAPNLDRLGMTDGLHGSVVVVLPTAVFASIVTASLMTLLLVLRLLRDECVNRVLRANAQQILTLELVSTAEALATLATQQERIDWRPGSAVMTALSRLDTAGRLIERHVWFREGLRDVEKRKVVTDMRRLSVEVLQLRGQLINAKEGTVLVLRDEVFRKAKWVHRGLFGELSVPVIDKDVSAARRLRVGLVRLAWDLPLALAPVGVIWLYDLIGFDSPGNQLPRSAMMGAGASFAMYVALRALDPTTIGKVALSSALLEILRSWGLSRTEDGKAEKPGAEPSGSQGPDKAAQPDGASTHPRTTTDHPTSLT